MEERELGPCGAEHRRPVRARTPVVRRAPFCPRIVMNERRGRHPVTPSLTRRGPVNRGSMPFKQILARYIASAGTCCVPPRRPDGRPLHVDRPFPQPEELLITEIVPACLPRPSEPETNRTWPPQFCPARRIQPPALSFRPERSEEPGSPPVGATPAAEIPDNCYAVSGMANQETRGALGRVSTVGCCAHPGPHGPWIWLNFVADPVHH